MTFFFLTRTISFLTCAVESSQVLEFKFTRVQLGLVGERSEERAVGKFVAIPVGPGRPYLCVAHYQSQRLPGHLIFRERFIRHSRTGVDLQRVGHLQERADKVRQSRRHLGLIFEKLFRFEGDVAA